MFAVADIYLETAKRLEELAKRMRTIWEELCKCINAAAAAARETLNKLHEALFGTRRAERYFFGLSQRGLKTHLMRPQRDPPGNRSYSPCIPMRKHLPYQMRRYR